MFYNTSGKKVTTGLHVIKYAQNTHMTKCIMWVL